MTIDKEGIEFINEARKKFAKDKTLLQMQADYQETGNMILASFSGATNEKGAPVESRSIMGLKIYARGFLDGCQVNEGLHLQKNTLIERTTMVWAQYQAVEELMADLIKEAMKKEEKEEG